MSPLKILVLLMAFSQVGLANHMDSSCFDPLGKNVNNSFSQSGLVSINLLSSPSTTAAMASGTSGCKTQGLVMGDQEAGTFLARHVDEMKLELANGQGEHIAAFGDLVGCQQRPDVLRFSLKSEQSPLIGNDYSEQHMLDWLHSLRNQCTI